VKVETPALPKRIVEEAERPFVRRRVVEVELATPPNEVVGVNGKAKFEKSVPATAAITCPPVVVLSSEPEAIPEIQRFVVEAVVAVIMVVEAYGKVDAEDEVEVMVPPTKRLLEMYPEPCTAKREPGVVVPTPTFPLLSTVRRVVVAEAVDEAIANNVVFVSPLFAWIDSFANGEVVPIPNLPVESILTLSMPLVEKPKTFEAGLYIPSVDLALKVYVGESAVPNDP
jgi:hypothetical protein